LKTPWRTASAAALSLLLFAACETGEGEVVVSVYGEDHCEAQALD
jgi:hypothetical protein